MEMRLMPALIFFPFFLPVEQRRHAPARNCHDEFIIRQKRCFGNASFQQQLTSLVNQLEFQCIPALGVRMMEFGQMSKRPVNLNGGSAERQKNHLGAFLKCHAFDVIGIVGGRRQIFHPGMARIFVYYLFILHCLRIQPQPHYHSPFYQA